MKTAIVLFINVLFILIVSLSGCDSEPTKPVCEDCREIQSTESFEDQYYMAYTYGERVELNLISNLSYPQMGNEVYQLCESSLNDQWEDGDWRVVYADGEIYVCADEKEAAYIRFTNYEIMDSCVPDIPMTTEKADFVGRWQIRQIRVGEEVIVPPCESGEITIDITLAENHGQGHHTMYMSLAEGGGCPIHFTQESDNELILSEYTEPIPADAPSSWRGSEFLLTYCSLVNQSIDQSSLVTYGITNNKLELQNPESGYVISLFKP